MYAALVDSSCLGPNIPFFQVVATPAQSYWTSDQATNQGLWKDTYKACQNIIYNDCQPKSNITLWNTVFGSAFAYSSQRDSTDIWYTDDNGVADFSDFQSFGGWLIPIIKTYKTETYCNVTVDRICYANPY